MKKSKKQILSKSYYKLKKTQYQAMLITMLLILPFFCRILYIYIVKIKELIPTVLSGLTIIIIIIGIFMVFFRKENLEEHYEIYKAIKNNKQDEG